MVIMTKLKATVGECYNKGKDDKDDHDEDTEDIDKEENREESN